MEKLGTHTVRHGGGQLHSTRARQMPGDEASPWGCDIKAVSPKGVPRKWASSGHRLPSALLSLLSLCPLDGGPKSPNPSPLQTRRHCPCTYMGGKESLPPAGSLGPSGVPTLLGYFELMAGSLTCVKKHTEPWLRDRCSDTEGGQSQKGKRTHRIVRSWGEVMTLQAKTPGKHSSASVPYDSHASARTHDSTAAAQPGCKGAGTFGGDRRAQCLPSCGGYMLIEPTEQCPGRVWISCI